MPKLVEVPTFKDERGDLSVIENILPFSIKRVFYIYNASSKKRGGHRHYKTIQAVICVHGECTIYVNNGKSEREFHLENPTQCLILFPEDWHTMNSFKNDVVLVVLASEIYDPKDYIQEEYHD